MSILENILETFPDEEFILIEGYEDAVIGIQISDMRLIYSISKCIDILTSQGETLIDAIEYVQYNIIDAYMGEKTPIYCNDMY